MTKILLFLETRPLFGLISTGAGVSFPFIETITPILQFFGLLIGVLIGAFTLYFRIMKFINTRKDEFK